MEQLIGLVTGARYPLLFPLQRTNFYGVLYRRMRRMYRRQSDHGERKENESYRGGSEKPNETQVPDLQPRAAQFRSQTQFIQECCVTLIKPERLSDTLSFISIRGARRFLSSQPEGLSVPALRDNRVIIVQVRRWRNFGDRTQYN